jgi:phage shock protein PspC (stress-responsive transcriptional regulator)
MASTSPVSAQRLTRTHDGLTGVGGGLAEYVGIDPVWVRFGLIGGTLLTFPLVPIAYVVAWLIIPKKEMSSPPPPPSPSQVPPPPRPSDARTDREAHDRAVAMAQARAEVEAIDRTPPSGPTFR